ncbi:hypothetical protein GCK32_009394 [Trichostrongylus colubriformis]|uniref:Uncharacterized protein n=1 Tax=Trichostrongylus colubriformis TaxID=6319 RepID=A0AAN8F3G2_TRICO
MNLLSLHLNRKPNNEFRNPDWPTVGNRHRFSKEPLTDEELTKSPFGKYLKDANRVKIPRPDSTLDSGKADLSSMNSSTGTVPSSPIPRAPTRYRNRIPSPWMSQPRQDPENRTTLRRVNSKSLPQITKPLCEFRGCNSCEVCKQGTITSRIYFPTTALTARSPGSSQKDVTQERIVYTRRREVKEKWDEEQYDEIISRNNTRTVERLPPVAVSATLPRASGQNAPIRPIDQRRFAPSPPPRGVPVRKPLKRDHLDYSPVTTVSADTPPESSESSSNDSVEAVIFPAEPHVVLLRARTSMDSGVGDDEESKVTRL